ncbi:helix-turn-helix transcriptional regulator, partial [Candidatus Bathyarchaeota archaeon]|nr:helix-turn-helix transcriptional regulator [Candidatus Bathyarchaeota archaeon]
MSAPLTLSAEFRKLVEARMTQVLKGIEDTFNQILETQKITPEELKDELESLQENFNMLFQKWSLEILYTLLLKNKSGFGELKKMLAVNSRTLSDKLKLLQKHGYIERNVDTRTTPKSRIYAYLKRQRHCSFSTTPTILLHFNLTDCLRFHVVSCLKLIFP